MVIIVDREIVAVALNLLIFLCFVYAGMTFYIKTAVKFIF